MRLASVLLLLALCAVAQISLAAEPLSKQDRLAAAQGRADACFDYQVPMLDDGLSPADVIAKAVETACQRYVDDLVGIQIKGRNYYYKRDYPAEQAEVSKQQIVLSVLRHRTGK